MLSGSNKRLSEFTGGSLNSNGSAEAIADVFISFSWAGRIREMTLLVEVSGEIGSEVFYCNASF